MNLRLQHIYNFHISKLLGSDLHLFEFSVWLHSFGLALISVFIPIILFQLGFSLLQILAFYAIFNIINVPLNLYARHIIEEYGARWAVILATIALIIYFVILHSLLSAHFIWLIVLAALLAFYDSFYWVGHLYIFVRSAHKSSNLRNDVGMLTAIRILGGLVAPIIGAYILIYGKEQTLIFVAALIMTASLIPLYRMRHLVFKPEEPTQGFQEFFQKPSEKVNYFFSALDALRAETSEVIWPFFIFFIYGSLKEVAYIPMLISISGLLLTLVAGSFSLKRNIYKMIAWSSFAIAVFWALRLFLYGNEFYAISSVFVIAMLGILMTVPLEVAIFHRAHETSILAATTYLNVFHMGARAVLYLVLIGVILLSANIFIASFYIITALMLLQFIIALRVAKRHPGISNKSLMEEPISGNI